MFSNRRSRTHKKHWSNKNSRWTHYQKQCKRGLNTWTKTEIYSFSETESKVCEEKGTKSLVCKEEYYKILLTCSKVTCSHVQWKLRERVSRNWASVNRTKKDWQKWSGNHSKAIVCTDIERKKTKPKDFQAVEEKFSRNQKKGCKAYILSAWTQKAPDLILKYRHDTKTERSQRGQWRTLKVARSTSAFY